MLKKFFYRVFCGFFLGLSVFAPGFSGSIVAIIMGVYQDLLRVVSNPFKRLRENIIFCLPLAIGAAVSAVLFVIVFKFLFNTYEKAVYLLFIGLITGNLPVIYDEAVKGGFHKRYLAAGVAAFAVSLTLGLLAAGTVQVSGAESVTSGLPALAISGFAAGVSALAPGMSVSMVLIIMGVYSQLIFIAESLLRMNFVYLFPFGLFCVCAAAGLILASRGIKAVFENFPGLANSVVFGLMSGSLIGILARSIRLYDPNYNWMAGGLALIGGLCVSMLFVALGRVIYKS
ncbi:MAG: DUF368 domain-containing protein [Clostridiales bacterium]|jgi:putative membrane protein|nr:DUF368 domain-containing protein [Clostridiales bacterium]